MATLFRRPLAVCIVCCLIFGAAVNVVIALIPKPELLPKSSDPPSIESPSPWPHPVPAGWPEVADRRGRYTRVHYSLHYWTSTQIQRTSPITKFDSQSLNVDSYGFPLRTAYSWYTLSHSTQQGDSAVPLRPPVVSYHALFQRRLPLLGDVRWPTIPIYSGLIVNTLFYASIALTLWQLPLILIARRRARQGACPRCAYPRAGIGRGAPCPDCGDLPPSM